uniref:Uncharacterized protein n=1 Tax=Neovison vison TaxID=452646 RepID=A0A8C7ALB3_NEOVI
MLVSGMQWTAGAVVGGGLAVAAVPAVLGALGFPGAGVAASSLAAKMMSAAAVTNGGGVASGSLVATLQSGGQLDSPRHLTSSWALLEAGGGGGGAGSPLSREPDAGLHPRTLRS